MLPKGYNPDNYNGKILWNENNPEIKEIWGTQEDYDKHIKKGGSWKEYEAIAKRKQEIKEREKSTAYKLITELSPKILQIVQSYNINNILVEEDLVQEANVFVLQYLKRHEANNEEDKEKIISNIKARIYMHIYKKIENMPEISRLKDKDKKRIIKSLMLEKIETNSKILPEEQVFTQNDVVINEKEMPEENLLHQETLEKLEEAFSKLPENHAKSIKMYYGIGCDPMLQKDIATELGVTSASISNYIRTGTEKIKRIMQNIDGIKLKELPSKEQLELMSRKKEMYNKKDYEKIICKKENGEQVKKNEQGYRRVYYNLFGELPENDEYIKQLKQIIKEKLFHKYHKEIFENYYGIETKRCSVNELENIYKRKFFIGSISQIIYFGNAEIEAEMLEKYMEKPEQAKKVRENNMFWSDYKKEKERIMEEYDLKEHEALEFMLDGYFITKKKNYSKTRIR